MSIKTQRIYDESKNQQVSGLRILVDRVWPRGISKEQAKIDHWLKDIGPSTELRKWFDHDAEKFTEFKSKYHQELTDNDDQAKAFKQLKQWVDESDKPVVLLFGAKDTQHNQAVVLQSLLS
ncbi:DUF488 domain-containing protein [Staphylococcus gallinarum]|uniref:DUF488 domain-containing protein n=1 Tax=Staphylococcus gallinarum TaxID=1293 RepID=UPI001E593B49|nr:DUF488 family protein [Staphylococcus gallinarum]MCD8844522.1 DUF488 family protein [Staphylococcus gallinarum]